MYDIKLKLSYRNQKITDKGKEIQTKKQKKAKIWKNTTKMGDKI